MKELDFRTIIISALIITGLGIAAYANSLDGRFLQDDDFLIKNNVYIKNWNDVPELFLKNIAAGGGAKWYSYRPLQMVTYMIDYHLWKLNVLGYHITNISLHILAALALYWLIILLFGNNTLSLLTSALFAVHPIHTEAVSFISGRADSLALLFMLLSFIFYIKYMKNTGAGLFIIVILSCVCALFSRENAVILPALFILYHVAFKSKPKYEILGSVVFIVLLYIVARMVFLKELLPHLQQRTTMMQRLPGFFVAVSDYVRLVVLPFPLHMGYGTKLFSFACTKAIAGMALAAYMMVYTFRHKSNNIIFFSMMWFMLALLPVSNLYPLNAYMAEHWLYVPSIGFILMISHGLVSLCRLNRTKVLALTAMPGLVFFYMFLTISQNSYWDDPIVYYERTLRYAPWHYAMQYNLGNAYRQAGNNEKAIVCYKRVLEMSPGHKEAYNNLGNAYQSLNHDDDAVSAYKKALEIDPKFSDAYNNLGTLLYDAGRQSEGELYFRKAIESDPGHGEAFNNLAIVYFNNKEYGKAIEYCDKAISLGSVNNDLLRALEPYRPK